MVSSADFADVVKSDGFRDRKYIVVIKDPKNLPGFVYNIYEKDLEDDIVIERVLEGKGEVNARRYNTAWQEVTRKVYGDNVRELFQRHRGVHWNIVDCDARKTDLTCFFIPHAIRDVSLNEVYKAQLTDETYEAADRVSHFLLVSQSGAITFWRQCFTATSVFYFMLKGCKRFYFVRPSENNTRLWKGYLAQPRRDLFFGSHPGLDEGGCVKVVVTERQAVCIPAGMIHFVETVGLSVAFG